VRPVQRLSPNASVRTDHRPARASILPNSPHGGRLINTPVIQSKSKIRPALLLFQDHGENLRTGCVFKSTRAVFAWSWQM
jgi:hypothetical protein